MSKKRPDIRSDRVAFVSHCLLCQAYQAEGVVRDFPAVVVPVISLLIEKLINIVQMPCPEAGFCGIRREPHGYRFYDTTEFRNQCCDLSAMVANQAAKIVEANMNVIGVIGVEYSPSCAVSYQYSWHVVKQKGIFMAALQREFEKLGLHVPQVGVTRHGTKPALRALLEIIGSSS